ncbi:MAG: C39 family peptidase [Ruminococcus sp.]|nr:C39 family peptidase [Ruminococcus sp.]
MINKFLKITTATIVATLTLTSCGSRVRLMNSSTEVDADTISSDGSYVEREEYRNQESIEPEKLIEQEITTENEPETEPVTIDIYQKDYDLPSKAVIDDFQTVMQNPELPTGCEITALTQTLNFLGFDIDKVTMCDTYMNTDWKGEYTMNQCYIGDPKSYTGFGCSAPVICKSARRYFRVEKSNCYPVDLTGTDFQELFYQIEQGRPVIVWATMYLMDTKPEYIYTAKNGEEMWFCTYQHCLTLYGYDKDEGIVYVADPLVGNTTYSLEKFERIYDILGKQAVVICGDAENGLDAEPKHVTKSGVEEIITESTTEEITETEMKTAEPETVPETEPEPVPETEPEVQIEPETEPQPEETENQQEPELPEESGEEPQETEEFND